MYSALNKNPKITNGLPSSPCHFDFPFEFLKHKLPPMFPDFFLHSFEEWLTSWFISFLNFLLVFFLLWFSSILLYFFIGMDFREFLLHMKLYSFKRVIFQRNTIWNWFLCSSIRSQKLRWIHKGSKLRGVDINSLLVLLSSRRSSTLVYLQYFFLHWNLFICRAGLAPWNRVPLEHF